MKSPDYGQSSCKLVDDVLRGPIFTDRLRKPRKTRNSQGRVYVNIGFAWETKLTVILEIMYRMNGNFTCWWKFRTSILQHLYLAIKLPINANTPRSS